MSVSRSTYRHRLSGEDVRKTRILITKDAWKLFPSPGERVALRIGARRFDAEIKSERCICVPPEHEHYGFCDTNQDSKGDGVGGGSTFFTAVNGRSITQAPTIINEPIPAS